MDKLAVPVGTSDAGDTEAPGGSGAESCGGFGQLAALVCGPVGTLMGCGSGSVAANGIKLDPGVTESADTGEAADNAVTAQTKVKSAEPMHAALVMALLRRWLTCGKFPSLEALLD